MYTGEMIVYLPIYNMPLPLPLPSNLPHDANEPRLNHLSSILPLHRAPKAILLLGRPGRPPHLLRRRPRRRLKVPDQGFAGFPGGFEGEELEMLGWDVEDVVIIIIIKESGLDQNSPSILTPLLALLITRKMSPLR